MLAVTAATLLSAIAAAGPYPRVSDVSNRVLDLTLEDCAIDVTDRFPLRAGPVETYTRGSVCSPTIPGGPVVVRTHDNIPLIAIDPFETNEDRIVDELQRQAPWIRRTDGIIDDLREARNRWKKANGHILTVRTFGGDAAKDCYADGAACAGGSAFHAACDTACNSQSCKAPEPETIIIYTGDPEAAPAPAADNPDPIIRPHDAGAAEPDLDLNDDTVIKVNRKGA